MHIMEAVMMLYAKEVVTPNRVMAAIQRLNHVPHRTTIIMPEDNEKAILLWVNRTVEALKHRISSSLTVGFICIYVFDYIYNISIITYKFRSPFLI